MFELPVPTNKCRIGLVEMDETSDACMSGAGEGAVWGGWGVPPLQFEDDKPSQS